MSAICLHLATIQRLVSDAKTIPVDTVLGKEVLDDKGYTAPSCVSEPLLNNITYSRHKRSLYVPAALNQKIDYVLYHMHMAYRKNVGEGVELECAGELTQEFLNVFPQATFRWKLNNGPFILAPDRMLYRNNAIVIQSLTVDDSGLYLCQMEYAKKRYKSFAFHSLIVIGTEPTVRIKLFQSFNLKCTSQFIGKLHVNSYRNWLFNGKIKKDFSKIPATKSNPEVIPRIEHGHAGTWTCEVIEPTNGKRWEIKFYLIQVGEPVAWVKGIDIEFTGKTQAIVISVCTVVVIALLILGMIIMRIIQQDDKQQEALDQIKTQMIRIKAKGIKLRGQTVAHTSGSSTSSGPAGPDSDSGSTSGSEL
ncbi:hypothetical protein LOTGIDRAFT_164699 [Lottia gigantea]|uniref:Ig-like domain-containing protein n=1 Tax=Lottia gigantea TaxID=225164 RepID=V4BM83_LOTGI|nr:hypothetical protein LOTGIDRAFT_164699 [Lottia gigantea]ESO89999.1 hypothetical protein LOTGIDRAFT_164699 [Lottia gigantea]